MLYRWNSKRFLVLLTFLLLPYLYLCFFTHPIGDDFVNSASTIEHGIWQNCIELYNRWSGRYTSNLLLSLNPIIWNSFLGYQLAIFINLAYAFFSFYLFFWVLHSIKKVIPILTISLSTFLIYLSILPTLSEGIYWFGGTFTYQIANSLFLNFITLLFAINEQKKADWKHFFTIALLLIISLLLVGLNEVILVFVLLTVSLYSFVNFLRYKNKVHLLLLIILPLIAASFAIVAPGNSMRATAFDNNYDLVNSLAMSCAQTLRFGAKWLLSPPFIIATLLFAAFHESLQERMLFLKKTESWNLKFTIGFLFLPIFIAAFLPYWSTGVLGQHRTMIPAWLIVLFAWFLNVNIALTRFKPQLSQKFRRLINYRGGLLLSLILTLVLSGNGWMVYSDFVLQKHINFDSQMTWREQEMLHKKTIYRFPFIQNPPTSLLIYDVSSKTDAYINRSYRIFFGREKAQLFGFDAKNDTLKAL